MARTEQDIRFRIHLLRGSADNHWRENQKLQGQMDVMARDHDRLRRRARRARKRLAILLDAFVWWLDAGRPYQAYPLKKAHKLVPKIQQLGFAATNWEMLAKRLRTSVIWDNTWEHLQDCADKAMGEELEVEALQAELAQLKGVEAGAIVFDEDGGVQPWHGRDG